ncbi:MAG: alkaline phosphatase [Oligoflexales bacterium]|nr:alkaline phosphatase [Oligoflexales bacterium]
MVEGGRIDHAAHVNNARNMFGDMIAFDTAIGSVLNKQQKDTLTLVTADHETGGLAISGYKSLEEGRGEGIFGKVLNFLEDDRCLLSFASGPGAKREKNDPNLHPSLYYAESAAHTAVDVPILAAGPGAQFFSGFMNNEEIPWRISKLMGVSFENAANLENHGLFDKPNLKTLSMNK